MLLIDRLLSQGEVLFRWRSFLPLILLPLAVVAILQSGYFTLWFGETVEEVSDLFCLGLSAVGLAIRVLTVGFAPRGTSGRNTSEQRAETLTTTGFYSVVRNPLYLGNLLVLLGFVLAIKVWWLVAITCLIFALYYERIICVEESYLRQKFGGAYTEWAAHTPAFFPNLRLWCRPALPFSLRSVLRREYNGFYLIVVVFTGIEFATDVFGENLPVAAWWHEDIFWVVFFAIGTVIFLILRTLKMHTRVLRVAGR